MTTICFKNGIVAVDSKMTSGHSNIGTAKKVFRMEDGSLVVGAGEYQHIVAFADWIRCGKIDEKPKIDDNFEGAHITANDGVVFYDTELVGYSYDPHRGIWALGSGADYALGAMAAGASAEAACALACEFDDGSSLPIHVMRAGNG